jgi:hypothetical protein
LYPALTPLPAPKHNRSRNDCPVHYDFEPCPQAGRGGPARATCCVIRTAAPIRKGEEVCLSYNYLSPDMALFHYGFELPDRGQQAAGPPAARAGGHWGSEDGAAEGVQAKSAAASPAPALSIIDTHGFDPSDLRRPHDGPPPVFQGEEA